jgi:hypothetical protein
MIVLECVVTKVERTIGSDVFTTLSSCTPSPTLQQKNLALDKLYEEAVKCKATKQSHKSSE